MVMTVQYKELYAKFYMDVKTKKSKSPFFGVLFLKETCFVHEFRSDFCDIFQSLSCLFLFVLSLVYFVEFLFLVSIFLLLVYIVLALATQQSSLDINLEK